VVKAILKKEKDHMSVYSTKEMGISAENSCSWLNWDAHCHYQDERMKEWLVGAQARGEAVFKRYAVLNGRERGDWDRVKKFCEQYPHWLAAYGVHPWWVGEDLKIMDEELVDLEQRISLDQQASVGEIGLDLWKNKKNIEEQCVYFREQWKLAVRYQRPITVHCVKAWHVLQRELKGLPAHPFLLHSYQGGRDALTGYVDKGAYFSISPYFAYPGKKESLDVFRDVPEDRLLVETDAPDMGPPAEMSLYQEIDWNHPDHLMISYELLRKIRNLELEYLVKLIEKNFKALFFRERSKELDF
jgi:TatD DNase family protein